MLYKISILKDGECLTQVTHIPSRMVPQLVARAQQRPDANQIVVSDGIWMVFVSARGADGQWVTAPADTLESGTPPKHLPGTPPVDERSKP